MNARFLMTNVNVLICIHAQKTFYLHLVNKIAVCFIYNVLTLLRENCKQETVIVVNFTCCKMRYVSVVLEIITFNCLYI